MKLKTLIVDDSPSSRLFLKTMLSEALALKPDNISLAANCDDALKKLVKQRFDLIFLDLYMPDKTGFEMLDAIRFAGIRTPVIIISSESDDHALFTAINRGANDYITKPVTPEVLAEKVGKVIGKPVKLAKRA